MAKFDHTTSHISIFSNENFNASYDFTNKLTTGETIVAATVTAMDSEENSMTGTIISNTATTSTTVSFQLDAITADKTYEVTIMGVSSSSNRYIRRMTVEGFGSVTLNSKLGDTNANSYVTVKEANDYVRDKYGHDNNWDILSLEGKKRLLIEATNNLESFNFIDSKYYDGQRLSFPFSGHDIISGNCATPLTTNSFKHSSLKSSTYGKYPQDYWQWGSCHLTDDNEVGLIASSNVTTGLIHMKSNFTASLTTSTGFTVFTPLDKDIKHAQVEQALFLIGNRGMQTIQVYRNSGAEDISIGDTRIRFSSGASGHVAISAEAKRLISRWTRKTLRMARR